MKTVTIGDVQAPNVVLGLMRIADKTDEEIRALIRTARDAGIDFFDHAAVYGPEMHGCESRFAEAMQLSPSERRRDQHPDQGGHRAKRARTSTSRTST